MYLLVMDMFVDKYSFEEKEKEKMEWEKNASTPLYKWIERIYYLRLLEKQVVLLNIGNNRENKAIEIRGIVVRIFYFSFLLFLF